MTQNASTSEQEVKYMPLTKYYVFNETGNILLATTSEDESLLSDSFREICAEAGVFFAAMSKSIYSVINPHTQEPYSIYNYRALKNVIDSSGVFVGVNQQRMLFKSDKVGEAFCVELAQFMLGRELNPVRLRFAKTMFGAMGAEAKCLCDARQQKGHDNSAIGAEEVGNIFFICESLLGMPVVSVIVVHYKANVEIDEDSDSLLEIIKGNFDDTSKERTLEFNRDTYLFISPKMVKNYAAGLNATNTPDFSSLVQSLSASLATIES